MGWVVALLWAGLWGMNVSARVLTCPETLAFTDPHGQLSADQPLSLALSDSTVQDRLKALNRSLEAEGEQIEVDVDEWNIWVRTTPHDGRPARLTIHFGQPLDEHPELIFHGILTQLLFDRMHLMKGMFAAAKEDTLKKVVAAVRASGLTNLDDAEIRREAHEVFKLRMAWILKVRFYEQYVKQNPWLREARLSRPGARRVIERLAQEDEFSQSDFDRDLLEEFTAFYSKNISQHLEPELIRLIWVQPLPGMWELSMTVPSMMQPRCVSGTNPASCP